MAAGLTPTLSIIAANATSTNYGAAFQQAANEFAKDFTGFDPSSGRWDPSNLARGLLPVVIGVGIHLAASKFGLNKALGRARVPILRI